MMQVLHPTYTIRVTVKEDPLLSASEPKFNSLKGTTGCDEVLKLVKDALIAHGIQATVFFERFEHS